MRAQIIRNIPDMAAVEEFCRRWHIAELGLFGSVLRDYFADNSDVDVLITYEEDMTLDRFDRLRAQDELSGILGRKVDWVTREAVAWWSTPRRIRDDIFETVETIYPTDQVSLSNSSVSISMSVLERRARCSFHSSGVR